MTEPACLLASNRGVTFSVANFLDLLPLARVSQDAPTARAAPTITTSPLATSGFSVGKSDASAVPAPVLCPGSEEKPLSSSIPISIGGSRSRHAASNDSSGVDEATQRFYGLPAKNAESEPKAHKSKYGPNAVNETAVRVLSPSAFSFCSKCAIGHEEQKYLSIH